MVKYGPEHDPHHPSCFYQGSSRRVCPLEPFLCPLSRLLFGPYLVTHGVLKVNPSPLDVTCDNHHTNEEKEGSKVIRIFIYAIGLVTDMTLPGTRSPTKRLPVVVVAESSSLNPDTNRSSTDVPAPCPGQTFCVRRPFVHRHTTRPQRPLCEPFHYG